MIERCTLNEIELLRDRITAGMPGVETFIDPPANPENPWWLDAWIGDRKVVVEWRPDRGFGLSDGSAGKNLGFGEGPDEVTPDAEAAFTRALQILRG